VTDKLRAVGIVLTFCLLLEGGWIGSGFECLPIYNEYKKVARGEILNYALISQFTNGEHYEKLGRTQGRYETRITKGVDFCYVLLAVVNRYLFFSRLNLFGMRGARS